jgi:cytochrome c556
MSNARNVVFTFLFVPCVLFAGGAHAAEPLALQKIMKDLGRNMQTVTDGISREDWALVEKTAALVADHPQPPLSEKIRILGFAGANVARFKAHDGETHAQAQAVGKAAKAQNGPGVILAFQKLQTSCYACHSEFRKPFTEHFYGSQEAVRQ